VHRHKVSLRSSRYSSAPRAAAALPDGGERQAQTTKDVGRDRILILGGAAGASAGVPEGAHTRMIQNINIARVSLITHGSLSALRTLDGVYIPRDSGGWS